MEESTLRFTKMHGAGNDYVFIDSRGLSEDWPSLAVAMSDRHTGIGSDGIILALPSERADLRMRMFNADGSEGEMCGNGIRCLVDFAPAQGLLFGGVLPSSRRDGGGGPASNAYHGERQNGGGGRSHG